MKALEKFESFLENVVEGSFRRLFKGRLEPVDLARRLGRVMDDHKRVTWDRPLVPNQYQIALSPTDYADVESFLDSLRRELEKFADDRAAERGYGMLAPAAVTVTSENSLEHGSFTVGAAMVDAPDPTLSEPAQVDLEDFGQTRAMQPLEMPVGPTGFETIYLIGTSAGRRTTWPVGGRLTIGRGLDNDVVLDDASVSRHHAEVIREGGRLEVRDLGSTNGTWVNAARVSAASVQPGDQLAFGTVYLEVSRRAAD